MLNSGMEQEVLLAPPLALSQICRLLTSWSQTYEPYLLVPRIARDPTEFRLPEDRCSFFPYLTPDTTICKFNTIRPKARTLYIHAPILESDTEQKPDPIHAPKLSPIDDIHTSLVPIFILFVGSRPLFIFCLTKWQMNIVYVHIVITIYTMYTK